MDTGPPNAQAWVIRPARPDDCGAILDADSAVAAEGRWIGTEAPVDRARRRELLTPLIDAGRMLVVDAGGMLVGNLSLRLAPYGTAEVGMLLVDGWRGRGIGSALLAAGTDLARSAGAHKLSLEVWPDNGPAIALYRRAGFVEEGRRIRHYRRRNGELWDSIIMGLALGDGPGATRR